MPEKLLTIEQVLSLLAETPDRIRAATERLPLARMHTEPAPGEWSANDVLHSYAHRMAIHERAHVNQIERAVKDVRAR